MAKTLAEWCKENGRDYTKYWRLFDEGRLEDAYRGEDGSIWVKCDDNSETKTMAFFFKKAFEYSENGSSVKDFASFVIENFQLRLNGSDSLIIKPKPSKEQLKENRERRSKEAQEHIKSTIKDIAPSKDKIEYCEKVKASSKKQADGYMQSVIDLPRKVLQVKDADQVLQGIFDPKNEDWLTNDETLTRMITDSLTDEVLVQDIVVESPTAPQKEQETLGAQDLPQVFETQVRKTQ